MINLNLQNAALLSGFCGVSNLNSSFSKNVIFTHPKSIYSAPSLFNSYIYLWLMDILSILVAQIYYTAYSQTYHDKKYHIV